MSNTHYSHDMAPDHCAFCKRPFTNGESFGILPEDPAVAACDKCARSNYDDKQALLLEIHLTGEPIEGDEEMKAALRSLKFFRFMLTGDDPHAAKLHPEQEAYLRERFDDLMGALQGVGICALPEGGWGMGFPTR